MNMQDADHAAMDRRSMQQGESHPPQEIDADAARQSRPVGRMRYVLAFGIALTLIGFALAYMLVG